MTRVSVTPDGRLAVVTDAEGGVELVELPSLRSRGRVMGHDGPVVLAQVSRDGRRAATTGGKHVVLWELGEDGPKKTREVECGASADAPLFPPDLDYALVPAPEPLGAAKRDDWTSRGRPVLRCPLDPSAQGEGPTTNAPVQGHTTRVLDLAETQDGKLLASSSSDGTLRLWDAKKGREVRVIATGGPLRQLRFSRDGRELFGMRDDALYRVEVKTGEVKRVQPATAFALSADGGLVVVAVPGRKVELRTRSGWKLRHTLPKGEPVRSWRLKQRGTGLAYSPDGNEVLTGEVLVDSLRIWNTRTGEPSRVLELGRGSAGGLELSWNRAGNTIVAVSFRGVHLFDGKSGEPRGFLAFSGEDKVFAAGLSANGRVLRVGRPTGAISLYERGEAPR